MGKPHASLERLPIAHWGKPLGAFNSELRSHPPFGRTAPPAAAWSQAGLPQQATEPRSWAVSGGGRTHAQIQGTGWKQLDLGMIEDRWQGWLNRW